MKRGFFITLEGGEGAGKSTQQGAIARWLEARGRQVLCTREPGGSPLAEAIRGVVLADWAGGVPVASEVLLMFAARAAHVRQTIEPALIAGRDVVCDRFVDSSWAYQGAGKGVDAAALAALERLAVGALVPDLTVVLDLPADVGLERARRRGGANRFESEPLAYRERVRAAFLERARREPRRCVVVDATAPAATVEEAIIAIVEERYPR